MSDIDLSKICNRLGFVELSIDAFEGAIKHVFPNASLGSTSKNDLFEWQNAILLDDGKEYLITTCLGLWWVELHSGKTLTEAADKWQNQLQAIVDANRPRLDAFKQARGVEF